MSKTTLFSHPGYTRAHELHFLFPVPDCHSDFLTYIHFFPPTFSPFSRVLPAFRLLLRARLFTCRRAGAARETVHILAGWCGNHMGTAISKVLCDENGIGGDGEYSGAKVR